VSAKVAPVVGQPSAFVNKPLGRPCIIVRFIVINIITSRKGGTENPCTMPD